MLFQNIPEEVPGVLIQKNEKKLTALENKRKKLVDLKLSPIESMVKEGE